MVLDILRSTCQETVVSEVHVLRSIFSFPFWGTQVPKNHSEVQIAGARLSPTSRIQKRQSTFPYILSIKAIDVLTDRHLLGKERCVVAERARSCASPVALLRAACCFCLSSSLSLPQSAALGRQARPSVPFFDFGCWLGRRGVNSSQLESQVGQTNSGHSRLTQ